MTKPTPYPQYVIRHDNFVKIENSDGQDTPVKMKGSPEKPLSSAEKSAGEREPSQEDAKPNKKKTSRNKAKSISKNYSLATASWRRRVPNTNRDYDHDATKQDMSIIKIPAFGSDEKRPK